MVPAISVDTVAGLQVPVNPFVEITGNSGGVLFRHSGSNPAKVGLTGSLIVMSIVSGFEHCPSVGVKV